MKIIKLNNKIQFSNALPFVVLAGPCVLESRDHAMMMAEKLVHLCDQLSLPFVFKASFDKANRTSLKAERGLGIEAGLKIFDEIRQTFGCPIVTDVHSPEQCAIVKESVDIIQIPAFLCRQTDLLKAASQTQKVINIKKGQFLAPWDMQNIIDKMVGFGNENILLCERGVSFGYNTLVSDMRSLTIMAKSGFPVVFDATHSVQQPGGQGQATGGQREFAPILARAALTTGIASVFMETHDKPEEALSDGPNMIRLSDMPTVLKELKAFDTLAKEMPRY